MCGNSVFPVSFVEEAAVFSVYVFDTFVKAYVVIAVWAYFWVLNNKINIFITIIWVKC